MIFLFFLFLNLHLSLGTTYFGFSVLNYSCVIWLSIFVMFCTKFIILILLLKIITLGPIKFYVRVMKVLQRTIFKQGVGIIIICPLSRTQKLLGGIDRHRCRLTLSDHFCNLLEVLRSINDVFVYHVDPIRFIHV
jgi:hypothetical protein